MILIFKWCVLIYFVKFGKFFVFFFLIKVFIRKVKWIMILVFIFGLIIICMFVCIWWIVFCNMRINFCKEFIEVMMLFSEWIIVLIVILLLVICFSIFNFLLLKIL